MKKHIKLFEEFGPLKGKGKKLWHLFMEDQEPLSLGVFDSQAEAKAERKDYIKQGLREGGDLDELENLYFIEPVSLDDHSKVSGVFKTMVDHIHFGYGSYFAKELIERFIALGADPKDMLLMEEWMSMNEIIKDLEEIFGSGNEMIEELRAKIERMIKGRSAFGM